MIRSLSTETLRSLNAMYDLAVTAHNELETATAQLSSCEAEKFNLTEAWDLLPPYKADAAIRALRKHFTCRLIDVAEKAFSPCPSASYSIGRALVVEAVERLCGDGFDACLIWKFLEDSFRESAPDTCFANSAIELIDGFSLRRAGNIVRRGNAIVMQMTTYGGKTFKGDFEFTSSDAIRYNKCMRGLETVAAWADSGEIAAQIAAFRNRYQIDRCRVISRENIKAVPGVLELVTFQTRIEFRLGGVLATNLPLFVAQYGQQAHA